MAGRKRRTLTAPARIVLCLLLAGISGYFLYHCALDVLTTFQLKEQIAQNKSQISELEDEQTALQEQKEKLQDPEYLKYMVRGKYLVTKDGEQVFKQAHDAGGDTAQNGCDGFLGEPRTSDEI